MTDQNLPAIDDMSFEQAMDELRRIVEGMERGDAKLDEAIGAYERGAQLRKHCEAKLKEAKMRIDQISLAADGSVKTEPFPDMPNPSGNAGADVPF